MNTETTTELKTEKQLMLKEKNKQYYSENKEDLQKNIKQKSNVLYVIDSFAKVP